MKQRFVLFRRSGVLYFDDTTSGKQTSFEHAGRDQSRDLAQFQKRNHMTTNSCRVTGTSLSAKLFCLPAAFSDFLWDRCTTLTILKVPHTDGTYKLPLAVSEIIRR
jgi:hypothetical protein